MKITSVLLCVLASGPGGLRSQSLDAQKLAVVEQRDAIAVAMAPSLERQKASIRQQAEARTGGLARSDFFALPTLIAPRAVAATGDCDRLDQAALRPMIERAAAANGVSGHVLEQVIRSESGGVPCAVSPKGAMGLMQLMPSAATDLGVADPFDPEQNVTGGAKLLRRLLTRYRGDLALALSAYNAGPERVDAAGGVPAIAETQDYVDSILTHLGIFSPEH